MTPLIPTPTGANTEPLKAALTRIVNRWKRDVSLEIRASGLSYHEERKTTREFNEDARHLLYRIRKL